MDMPRNEFKRAIREGRQQIGLWCTLPGSFTTEALAGCGYDWLLIDTEHAPDDPLTVLPQLQAVAPYPVSGADWERVQGRVTGRRQRGDPLSAVPNDILYKRSSIRYGGPGS